MSTSSSTLSSEEASELSDAERRMVVSSDKIDYGSFAEPTPTGFGVLVEETVGSNNGGSSSSVVVSRSANSGGGGGSSSVSAAGAPNNNSHRSRTNSLVSNTSNTNSLRSSTSGGAGGSANLPVTFSSSGGGKSNNKLSSNSNGVQSQSHQLQHFTSSSGSIHSSTGNPSKVRRKNSASEYGLGLSRELQKSLSSSIESQQGAAIIIVNSERESQSSRPGSRSSSGVGNYLQLPSSLQSSNNNNNNKHNQHHAPTHNTIVVLNNNNNCTAGTSTQAYSNSPSPMSTTSGDLLYQRQPLLQNCENGGWNHSDGDVPLEVSSETGADGKRTRTSAIRIDVPGEAEPYNSNFPKEKRKTLLALVCLACNFIMATLSLALTHQRLPDRTHYKPLPDIILDSVTTVDGALYVSEILIMISVAVTVTVIILHRHRWIVFRRAFLILAALYLMRSLTMFVTVLPVSSYTYYCSPPSNATSFFEIVQRALRLLSGFGLSINGEQVYCGDYIYSGHTVILVTAYLFIQEYSSPKLYLLHWASFLTSLTGVILVLISRGHYTIDVIVAYYVTTRLFWIYHTLANNASLKRSQNSRTNFLARIWWYPVFNYMEGNVGGPLPRKYSFPWSSKIHRTRRNI